MRKILDKMFARRRLSLFVPMLAAALTYLLFIIFGASEDKVNLIIATPIASVFWFFGVFFIIYIQIKNERCPENFLNLIELIATFFFVTASLVFIISFMASGLQGFNPLTSPALLTYAAVSWAHSKRTK